MKVLQIAQIASKLQISVWKSGTSPKYNYWEGAAYKIGKVYLNVVLPEKYEFI